jgi:hypothetical protein
VVAQRCPTGMKKSLSSGSAIKLCSTKNLWD